MKKYISFVSYVLTLSVAVAFVAFSSPKVSAADSSSTAGKITTSQSALNVRSGMGSSYSIIGGISKGSYVTLISKSGSWWKVEYSNGEYGYCYAQYIEAVNSTSGYVNTVSSGLNVRTGVGTTYSVQNTISRGTNILILSETNGWYKILYNGTQTGYVSALYIKENGSYSYVSLNTQDYKQTDSRWANTEVGSSEKTIAQIGCVVCCLSITESYRTKSEIIPNDMESMLSFTPGGAVYWPTNCVLYTGSDYLDVAYSQIIKGNPVMIGGKTFFGSTHYVVITGFTGGTLSAENFLIKDPGTSTRITLSQYLSKYTTVSKIVYYK